LALIKQILDGSKATQSSQNTAVQNSINQLAPLKAACSTLPDLKNTLNSKLLVAFNLQNQINLK
jgi:hypothetical protein